MSILGKILGKSEEEKKPEEKKPASVKAEKKKDSPVKKAVKSEKPGKVRAKTGKATKTIKKERNIAHRILMEPLVTEKSTGLGQFGKYVFKANQGAGKNQIKEAIQDYYGVGVVKVNIVRIHPKKRVQGRTIGWKK